MSESIREISDHFSVATEAELQELFLRYQEDSRTGVQKILEKYRKKQANLATERERLFAMTEFERKYAEHFPICGIDEAGRGPLAGPVVAGAVILPRDCEILYLNDSKKVSPKRRELLFDEITKKAEAYGVGVVSPKRIDEINILQATYEAMRMAVDGLGVRPEILLNDAVTIPDMEIVQVPVVHGDARSVSIAAASILAKVTRDRIMVQMDQIYPGYGFAKHKGYGSAEHIAALKRLGPSEIHRESFLTHFL